MRDGKLVKQTKNAARLLIGQQLPVLHQRLKERDGFGKLPGLDERVPGELCHRPDRRNRVLGFGRTAFERDGLLRLCRGIGP